MTRKLFGTDGIRGTANSEPVTAETALAVAMAAGAQFTRGPHRHQVVIGKDTRLSGYMLEPALTAGFISVGMDVVLLGPLPTPAVGMLTRSLRADLGVVISASHNPYEDNGIKLFGPDGYKLSDEVEHAIEARIGNGAADDLAPNEDLGRARRLDDALGRYIEFVKSSFPLGADVVALGVEPDGFNINRECGATHPGPMQQAVAIHGAHLGLALDGDADRLVLADERGRLVDGDQLLALIARSWLRDDRLKGGGIVGTVMSNLGLERLLNDLGLGLARTPVGDRYVVECMREGGFNLGGEQSGHIILSDFSTTGDGLIAALQALAVLIEAGRPASETMRLFDPLPQLIKSVAVDGGAALDDRRVLAAIRDGEATLGDRGRLLIRKSGTEPVIRVMAEGEDESLIGRVVDDIVETLEAAAG
jgi:phosphoglucosamine mutase